MTSLTVSGNLDALKPIRDRVVEAADRIQYGAQWAIEDRHGTLPALVHPSVEQGACQL